MKKLFVIFLSVSAIFLNGCSRKSSDSQPLRIGLMPTMDSVAIATAYELGLFEKHSVDIELIPFSSARDRDSAFISGNLDGATVDLIAVGLYNEAGISARATSVTTAHFSLIAQPGFDSLSSLKDSRVMISHNTAIEFVLDQILEFHNLPTDHIRKYEVGNIPSRFEMVRVGQAESALISEPFATMAAADGLSIITDTFELGFNPFVLAFTLDVIENRFDELQAFYKAYNEAVDFLNNNPIDEHLDLIINLIGFPNEVVNYIELPHFLNSESPRMDVVETARYWLIKNGLISNEMAIEDFVFDVD